MNRLFKSYKDLDRFLKWQLIIGLITSLTWSLCIPIMHKLQGLYWSTTYISVYLACDKMSGLFIPLFRGGSLKLYFVLCAALSAVYALSIMLYFIDVQAFLILEVILGMAFGVLGPLWRISYDMYVVKNYSKEVYEDFLYLDGFRSSLGGVLGSAFVAVVSAFFSFDQTVISFFGAMIIMLVLEAINWRLFYRNMNYGASETPNV